MDAGDGKWQTDYATRNEDITSSTRIDLHIKFFICYDREGDLNAGMLNIEISWLSH